MGQEPLYDPDQSAAEDLDFTDPRVALAYLNHPNTEALADDLGRAFKSLTAEHQQREIVEYLSELVQRRTQALAALADLEANAPGRPLVQQIVEAIDRHIEAAKLRMLELDEQ